MVKAHSYKDFILQVGQWLMENYWAPMWRTVQAEPELVGVVPGFLIQPEKLIYYIGRTHIGIEYVGPERLTEMPTGKGVVTAQYFDYSLKECNLLNEIIGLDFSDGTIALPLPPLSEDLVLPTNAGFDELERLKWNWAAQEMALGLNTGGLMAPEGQFTRIVNGRFFDVGESGLKVRYIRWLDLIPCKYDGSGDEFDRFSMDLSIFSGLAKMDPRRPFPVPDDFRLDRLQRVNRFVELLGDRSLTEPRITSALADKKFEFILRMRFSATTVYPELLCEWQGGKRKAIKPDFSVVGPDGFADIVEFKLPETAGVTVVGRDNREAFSAQVNSYIAQTRVYLEHFDDPRNREYVQKTYGFQAYKPRRFLVVGRRWHFSNSAWRAIAADHHGLSIMTYDDLIDGVVAQFFAQPAHQRFKPTPRHK